VDEADQTKIIAAINGFSSPTIAVRYPYGTGTGGLERDAVWGLFKQADITNPYFATSAFSFQIVQMT
jgi:hypothetical protein